MRRFSAGPLREADIARAYALIQVMTPEIGLAAWRRFALPLVRGKAARKGIVALHGDRQYLCGLFVWRIDQDLRHGRTLVVDYAIGLDMVSQDAVTMALVDAIEDAARRLKCGAVHSHVGSARGPVPDRMSRTGYQTEGVVLCKRLPCDGWLAAL